MDAFWATLQQGELDVGEWDVLVTVVDRGLPSVRVRVPLCCDDGFRERLELFSDAKETDSFMGRYRSVALKVSSDGAAPGDEISDLSIGIAPDFGCAAVPKGDGFLADSAFPEDVSSMVEPTVGFPDGFLCSWPGEGSVGLRVAGGETVFHTETEEVRLFEFPQDAVDLPERKYLVCSARIVLGDRFVEGVAPTGRADEEEVCIVIVMDNEKLVL